MVKITRAKKVSTDRIIRIRNNGLRILEKRYADVIKRTTYNIKDISKATEKLYSSLVTGLGIATGIKSIDLFEGLNQRINQMLVDLGPKYRDAFNEGSKKIMDSKGQILSLKKPKYDKAIEKLTRDNLKYVKNITDTQKKKMLDILKDGIKEGKSVDKLGTIINKELKGISEERAKMIAITEINKATTQSMKDTMRVNGIKKYMWVTANDNRVAPLDSALHKRIFNFGEQGTMQIRDTEGKSHIISKSPMPIVDTHPRCRCIIVSAPKS